MKHIPGIAFGNLRRRPARSILTACGIALSAWVLSSLLGFNRGYDRALAQDIDQMGFQILVSAKGCPYEAATLMLTGGAGLRYLPADATNVIKSHQEVTRITPMLMQAVFDPNKGENGGMSAFLGVDPVSFPITKPYLKFRQGGWFTNAAAMEIVLGYEAAELEQREVGDLYLIAEKNVELLVVGVLERSGTQDDGTLFIPLSAAQRIFDKPGKLTGVGVQAGRDADVAALEEKLIALPDTQVVSMAQVRTTISNLVGTARVLVFSIAAIAVAIAMLGVANTVLMSVMERTRELGILKSMGAMPFDIFRLVWIETLLLALAGGILGNLAALGLSKLTELIVRNILPYAPTGRLIEIDGGLVLLSLGAVLAIGLLSGLYPAWRAARVRPLEAIREGD
jgi:putative ABC transport system permease protein